MEEERERERMEKGEDGKMERRRKKCLKWALLKPSSVSQSYQSGTSVPCREKIRAAW